MELADTLDLGSSAFGVRVQIPPLAIPVAVVDVQIFFCYNAYGLKCGSSSVVELHLAKVDVESSNLFSRFFDKRRFCCSRTAVLLCGVFMKEFFIGNYFLDKCLVLIYFEPGRIKFLESGFCLNLHRLRGR